jgi:hypothetical protein
MLPLGSGVLFLECWHWLHGIRHLP